MKDNIPKFILVGVMILVTVFLNHRSKGEFENLSNTEMALEPKLAAVEFVEPKIVTSSAEKPAADPRETSSSDIQKILDGSDLESVDADLPKTEESAQTGDSKKATLEKQPEQIVMPETNTAAATVLDLETGAPYFSFKGKIRWPMASLTKLMTAAVATKNMSLTQEISITDADFKFLDEDSAKVKLGERYALGDLLRVMLQVSSNEAAEAIANVYGRERFIKMMNDQAKEWGMDDTNFDDPTGISVSNQSTITDLYKMTWQIYSGYPEIFKITRKTRISVKELASQKFIRFSNINNFAGRADFLGGKTGFTDEAQGNLISIFALNNRPIGIIVLGTIDRFGESEKLWNWFRANYSH